MSSAEAGTARVTLSRRSLVRGLSPVLAVAPALAACGNGRIRPLYESHAVRRRLPRRMAQVDVATIPGRIRQRIRNDLIFLHAGGGHALPPTHRLEVTIRRVGHIHSRQDRRRVAGADLCRRGASFQLISIKDKKSS